MHKNIKHLMIAHIRKGLFLLPALTIGLNLSLSSGVSAVSSIVNSNNGTPKSTDDSSISTNTGTASLTQTQQQQHLANIKTLGDKEITRRLNALTTAQSKISSTTKLTAADKTTLSNEVNTELSGLGALKAQLDGETTLTAAITDSKAIFTDYRVYALVLPKIYLVVFADRQQQVETNLTNLAAKIQTRITADETAGKDVTSLQSDLVTMNSQINSASTISVGVESSVITLQPSDYNSDNSVLSGYNTKLRTAQSDIATAYQDAKNLVTNLEAL